MRCKLESEHPVTEAACKAATGKTLKQWYADLSERNALQTGRRIAVRYMYDECKVDIWWATTIAVEFEKQAGQVKKDGLFEGYGICATKTISAPLADVYNAWTTGAALSEWFGAKTKADVKDGGSYSNPDGDSGKFLRVRPNKDLRFTWENPAFSSASLVDVTFEDKGGSKTLLIANHSRIQTRAEADGLRSGWSEAFTKLKTLLEK